MQPTFTHQKVISKSNPLL